MHLDRERLPGPPVATEPLPPVVPRAEPRRLPRSLWSAILTALALSALSITVVATAVQANPAVWYVDEWTYIDYLHKVHDGRLLMPLDDEVGQEAMRDVSCRGIARPGAALEVRAPCDSDTFSPDTWMNAGRSTAGAYPPTYVILTDLGARAVLATGVTNDLVTAGRLVGAAWMAAGLGALLLLMRELRVPVVARALGVLLIAVAPRMVETWQYLTPDAANLLVGSAVLLAALRWARGTSSAWWLGAAGAGAVLVKFPNVLVVCAGALVILLLRGPGRSLRQRLTGAGVLCGTAAGAAAVFLVVSATNVEGSREPSPLVAAQAVTAFDPLWLTDNVAAFLGPWGRSGTAVFGLSALVAVTVLGTLLATALGGGRADGRAEVARAVSVVIVAGPALLVVLTYVVAGAYFEIQERYGFSLLPGAVALAASSWSRGAQAVVAAVGLPYVALSAVAWSSPVPGA